MPKIIMTVGIPGSGKSTWAKQQVDADPNLKRVSKDDLRAMLDNSRWSGHNEKFVLAARDYIVEQSLKNGHNIIVDDTNLHLRHYARMKEIAAQYKSTVEVIDWFLQVPLEQCIANDLKRPNSVGEAVIRDMHRIAFPEVYVVTAIPQDHTLPKAVIFDIDGTLANMNGRDPFDWDSVDKDTLIEEVYNAYKLYRNEYAILILSGRNQICEQKTIDWLHKNGIEYDALMMRPTSDNRKDAIIKEEFLHELVKHYYIEAAFDDRDQIVAMWRKNGIRCFQVAPGNF